MPRHVARRIGGSKGLAMKLVSFEFAETVGYGSLEGDAVVRFDTIPGAAPDLKAAIGLEQLADLRLRASGSVLSLADIRLLPPIPNAAKILCIATNYREPQNADAPLPDYPIVFTRFADSLTGHTQPLRKPSVSAMYDFEGELAVIIGRRGFQIARERAHEHVAGFCCFNDGSVRDWQRHTTQFAPGKNFYRSGSVGPWIVTPDEMPDFSSAHLRTTVNGVLKQEICLDRMIFDIPWLVAYFSTFTPLAPGDIIATGTPSGFGSKRNPPEFLTPGDVVEVDITGIGTLRNSVTE